MTVIVVTCQSGVQRDRERWTGTETMNGLAKRVKRIAFGMTNFVHWPIRVLLYAGRPNWSLLPTVTP